MSDQRPPRRRLRIVALIIVLVAAVAACTFVAGDGPTSLVNYSVVDDSTISVRANTGPTLWARVSNVTETGDSVSVTVRSVGVPGPSVGTSSTDLLVHLSAPLGSRTVYDGSAGIPIPRKG